MAKVLIVAGEASGELYASRIIEEAKRQKLNWEFFGIGSQRMKSLGCEVVEYSEKIAVVGLLEVLSHWGIISRAFRALVGKAYEKKPEVAILIDYPGFNLRLAKKLHGLKIPIIYFVSPQVWAWKKNRVFDIKKLVSKMLVVFPFEKTFYDQYKVDSQFVGHPIIDEIKQAKLSKESRVIERAKLGFQPDDIVLGCLPGSRHSEIKYNLETQLRSLEKVVEKNPKVKPLLLVAPSLNEDDIKSKLPTDLKLNLRIIRDDPLKILQICDLCLVASGTATLMTALVGTPLVIMYKMNFITGWLAKRLVTGPKFFGMPNLLLDEMAAPEFFQNDASPENLSNALLRFANDKNILQQTSEKLLGLNHLLGSSGAIEQVVNNIKQYVPNES